jgi:hypothetical protein
MPAVGTLIDKPHAAEDKDQVSSGGIADEFELPGMQVCELDVRIARGY